RAVLGAAARERPQGDQRVVRRLLRRLLRLRGGGRPADRAVVLDLARVRGRRGRHRGPDRRAARHLLPPGRVRRGARRRRQPRRRPGVGRLHAEPPGAGVAAGEHVRLPGRRGGRAARVVGRVRTAGRRPDRGRAGGDRRRPGRLDRDLDRDRPRLTVPTPDPDPTGRTSPPSGVRAAAARRRPRRPLARGPRGRGVGRVLGWGVAAAVPLLFLGVFFAWPTASLVARGFVTDGALDLSGFGEVLGRPRTWRIVGLTLLQATLGTVLSVLLGLPAAYVLYRCTFRGRTVLRALVTVPFVLPTVVVGVAFRALLAPSGPLG